ncbi:succinyl-CoA--3-ketoacid-CoA transferase, partial [Myxococcota bacterium]|nr:succinyl-CoA--3-ketoacid-CoA transferase [Myxococcota bacterium]
MDRQEKREMIAKRIARELEDGYYVNLGIGIPTLVANYIPEGKTVFIQSENGILGVGPMPEPGMEDRELINAGGGHITAIKGAAIFDSFTSFSLIRGGHLDMSVLGSLQVDEAG